MLLLYKGLHLIADAAFRLDTLCYSLGQKLGSTQKAATVLIGVALIIGFIKGRFVLVKTVRRVVGRIATLPSPVRLKSAYSPSYWFLIGGMMLLGMVFRFLPLSIDIRGMIDVAIGSALINGAMLYFRAARAINLSV